MATYAVLDASGNIINRIVLDDISAWIPEAGHSIVEEKGSPFEIGGTLVKDVYTPPYREPLPELPPPPARILSQDLMAQFTDDDNTRIKAAVDNNIRFWGMWSAMQAQSEPMLVSSERFQAGWAALTTVLGSKRTGQIAGALGVRIS
jgi:hypothetical protein